MEERFFDCTRPRSLLRTKESNSGRIPFKNNERCTLYASVRLVEVGHSMFEDDKADRSGK